MWKRVKNRVQGRVTRFRVPGGAAPAEADAHRQADPVYDDRSMPIAASILWKPIDGAAEEGAGLPPIFITQRALAAVHDHCAATRAACFGLLIGDVVNLPETGAPYVVVESTIRLPGSPDEDAKTVLVQGWVVAQDVLRKSGDLLVGWYRGGGGEAALSPGEADAHRAFFVQPWQLAVVVGSGDLTVGGVFRRSASSAWAHECLPFYELVDPSSIRPAGSKPRPLPAHARGGCGDARGATGPRRRHPGPRDRRVRPAGPAVRQPADAMSRAGARAGPRRGALDGLQRRAEGQRRGARLRPHGPGP